MAIVFEIYYLLKPVEHRIIHSNQTPKYPTDGQMLRSLIQLIG